MIYPTYTNSEAVLDFKMGAAQQRACVKRNIHLIELDEGFQYSGRQSGNGAAYFLIGRLFYARSGTFGAFSPEDDCK